MARLSKDEIDRLAAEITSLSRANLPLPEGLRILARTVESGRLRGVATEIAAGLERGQKLSDLLRSGSVRVTEEFIALVECAELSGDLRSVFEFALEHSRATHRHRSALLTAALYPLVIVVVLLMILCFFANFVMPKFVEIFEQLGAELPAMTQLSFDLLGLFEGTQGIVLCALVLAAMAAILGLARPREATYNLMARLPGFMPLVSLSDTAVSMKFLGLMLAKRVPLPVALRAASLTVSRAITRVALTNMGIAADRGLKVAPLLSRDMPATAVYLFHQAEERGDLADVCSGIAAYCESRFERLSRRAVALFEPVLIVAVAMAVGYIVVSLYLPLFSIPKLIR